MKASTVIITKDVVSRPNHRVRVGWAKASRHVAASGDDALVMPEFANQEDMELKWQTIEDDASLADR